MTDACGHETAPKPSKRRVAAALKAGEARSVEVGSRFTPLRRRALELLVAAGGPVKAYDLITQLKTGAATAPPTVYRTLDTLVDMGLAHRIASLNAYVACQHEPEAHVPWFMICDCCGSVEEVARPAEGLRTVEDEGRFQIHALEAHGRCGRCA